MRTGALERVNTIYSVIGQWWAELANPSIICVTVGPEPTKHNYILTVPWRKSIKHCHNCNPTSHVRTYILLVHNVDIYSLYKTNYRKSQISETYVKTHNGLEKLST